jgi:hypothetical protein
MWIELAKDGGLVLGTAISIYTIYSFVETRIPRRRQQYALLKNVYEEFSYFIGLSFALATRANQAKEVYKQYLDGSYPAPAADKDMLPKEAEMLARWLVKRANHLIGYPIPVDVEKLGALVPPIIVLVLVLRPRPRLEKQKARGRGRRTKDEHD